MQPGIGRTWLGLGHRAIRLTSSSPRSRAAALPLLGAQFGNLGDGGRWNDDHFLFYPLAAGKAAATEVSRSSPSWRVQREKIKFAFYDVDELLVLLKAERLGWRMDGGWMRKSLDK